MLLFLSRCISMRRTRIPRRGSKGRILVFSLCRALGSSSSRTHHQASSRVTRHHPSSSGIHHLATSRTRLMCKGMWRVIRSAVRTCQESSCTLQSALLGYRACNICTRRDLHLSTGRHLHVLSRRGRPHVSLSRRTVRALPLST